MQKITLQPFDASHIPAVMGIQSAYSAIYPDSPVVPGEVYLSPAFEGNIFCAVDENGKVVGYAPLYPVLMRDESQLPHTLWTEVKAHPESEAQNETKDLLFERILLRARIRRQEEKRMLELKAAAAFYEAEQQERLRIARDLHDSLGQILSATKMVLGSVRDEQAYNKSALHKTTALVDSAISEVRSISYNLLPDALQFGVEKALLNLARKLSGETGIEIACEISNSTQSKIPSDVVSLSIYRIAQEVLSNMLKHSQCSMISIKSDYIDTTFVLEIKDNGRGLHCT